MPHYTLLSGVRTDTVTSRCPVCLKVRLHTEAEVHNPQRELTASQLCCSWEHRMIQTEAITSLARYERVWLEKHYPGLLATVPWEAEGLFWREHGGIDVVDKSGYSSVSRRP